MREVKEDNSKALEELQAKVRVLACNVIVYALNRVFYS